MQQCVRGAAIAGAADAAAAAAAAGRCAAWLPALRRAAPNPPAAHGRSVRCLSAQHQQHQQQQQQQQAAPAAAPLRSCSTTACAAAPAAAAGQTAQQLPSLLELVGTHGARLTTAAQMVWAEVLRPGDTVVDATAGNGHDSLFIAQRIGPTGQLYAIDLQESAVAATKHLLQYSLPEGARPALLVSCACHSSMQQLVGSGVASLVTFNLGYLPGGDKSVTTQTGSTLAAMQAALQVVRPGGLVSVLAYVGHPGGLEEYEAVQRFLAGLPPAAWTCSELRLLNRPSAPIMLLVWRRAEDEAR